MSKILRLISRAKHLFVNDSLFRNAALLMASTAVMSILGFFFWVFIAHLYSPSQIGEASALIAVTVLISNLSLLGLNAGLIRFLPKSKDQSRDINTAIFTVGIVTMLVAAIYLLISVPLNIHLPFLTSRWHDLAFVVLMSTISLNSLTDAVFIANRKAEYHTAGYTILGLVKLILPLFLVPFGSLGIFLAYIIAVMASLFFSLIFMWRACDYKITARPEWGLIPRTWKYSTNNYLAVILSVIPSQVMPLLILKKLGTSNVAFFAMAWTMANLLYVIPSGATQSLLAESSNNPKKKALHVKHTISLLVKVLVPFITFSILIAPYLLKIFGMQYSHGSTTIFQIFAFSTVFIAISSVMSAILNIEHRSSGILISQIVSLVVTFASAALLIHKGLTGVGIAMLLGYIATSITLFIMFKFYRFRDKHFFKKDGLVVQGAELGSISDSAMKRLLRAYGIKDFDFEVLNDASNGNIYLIRLKDGFKILKVYTDDHKNHESIEQEVKFINFLYAKSIPVPHLIPNLKRKVISHIKIDNISLQYVLMEFEQGSHPSSYSKSVIDHMAHNQAKMHLYGYQFAKSTKGQIIDDNVIQRSFKNLIVNPSSLLYFAPKGYSHFDFDASNILVQNNRITCILDFEGSRRGPLVSCVFYTLSRIYARKKDATSVEEYLTTYQKVRRLSFVEKIILSIALTFKFKNPRFLFVYS